MPRSVEPGKDDSRRLRKPTTPGLGVGSQPACGWYGARSSMVGPHPAPAAGPGAAGAEPSPVAWAGVGAATVSAREAWLAWLSSPALGTGTSAHCDPSQLASNPR